MDESIVGVPRIDREILSFFAETSFVVNPAVVAVNVDSTPEVVGERIRHLRERGYLKTHGYFDDLYKITDEGERVITNAPSRVASLDRAIEARR